MNSGTWISGRYTKNSSSQYPNSRMSGSSEIYYHPSSYCISGLISTNGPKRYEEFHLGPKFPNGKFTCGLSRDRRVEGLEGLIRSRPWLFELDAIGL